MRGVVPQCRLAGKEQRKAAGITPRLRATCAVAARQRPNREAFASSGSEAHNSNAPPTPCRQRTATSSFKLPAAPQPSDAAPNSAKPASSRRREVNRDATGRSASTPTIAGRIRPSG
jgi:hypothetical protein